MPGSAFHPLVQQWFDAQFDAPTDIQAQAWPRIADGDHLLMTAPTGSGKTLTAFLWSINRFITGDLQSGATRILYVSPLKALNNDIQQNLMTPLSQLRRWFDEAATPFPTIRVQTRSGDTDSTERRKMLRHPPEILITTPESLNLLLSSRGGQAMLMNIETVILDEIHGVIDSKRGVHLMSAVERLTGYSGEFQRLALSATINPMDQIAGLVAGYERHGDGFEQRKISILVSNTSKNYEISVRYPEQAANRGENEKIWDSLAEDFVEKITQNKSTLLFVNSRAICEKLTYKINLIAEKTIAYAHHGSLSREIRRDVEQRLKEGRLSAIVATSTLEMGIDIGDLDEVLLVQSPGSISSSVQRIGRAGHGVGEISRGTIYPTDPHDFIEAAVLSRAVLDRDIEPVKPIHCPLDVLAQIIISMTGTTRWDIDELFLELRRPTAYNSLTRQQFDLVLNMLAGRYADNHIRELKPRVIIDRLDNTIEAKKGALLSLYLSGGVIPDRGYFQLRHEDGNARIGELDEEFVWEANVGKVFAFGTQNWQVKKITHNDVIVSPAKPTAIAPPFWKAESLSRNFHYADRVGKFLEQANANVERPEYAGDLIADYQVEPAVADEIISYLMRQKEHCDADLPHRHHLLVERINSAPGRASGHQIVLHTGWGAMVNRPFAMALEAGWQESFGEQPEIFVSNESIVVQLPHEIGIPELLGLAPAEKIEDLLRARLEGSGFFGARFRENAGRALLLSKGKFNERKPLWMSRLQSQKLMDSVLKYQDFPILLETWRGCLQDEFDLSNLKMLLGEIDNNQITITEVVTSTPSPFAQSVAWGQINTYMYMDDQPKSSRTSNLKQSLLEEVAFTPDLRPALPLALIQSFEKKQHRLLPGYLPENEIELIEWLKERSFIPVAEWQQLLDLSEHHLVNTGSVGIDSSVTNVSTKILQQGHGLVVPLEDLQRIEASFQGKTDEDESSFITLIGNWLQHYGPVTLDKMVSVLGLPATRILPVLNQLEEEASLIAGQLVRDSEAIHWCDTRNYTFLLGLLRRESQVSFAPLALAELTPFLYQWQTRHSNSDTGEQLFHTLEQLRCYNTNAEFWETDLLPARIIRYETGMLDQIMQQGEIHWVGQGEKKISFCFREDEDLLGICPEEENADRNQSDANSIHKQLLPDGSGKYDFAALLDQTGKSASTLAKELWQSVWQSRITNDSMMALRTGIEHNFRIPEATALTVASSRKLRRGGFNRWKGSIPFGGNWHRVHIVSQTDDELLEKEELNKDRARTLIDRYGIVFRELVNRELPALRWSRIFRSLRLMELSGEILSGYFFKDIPGPQFISPVAYRLLQQSLPTSNTTFWINAVDPISPCGLGLAGFGDKLPRRVSSNHLVFQGSKLVLVSARNGKALTIHVPPDHDGLPGYLSMFRHLLYRSFRPMKKIEIETINEIPVRQSPYLDLLDSCFDLVKDHKSVVIQRNIQGTPDLRF